ncbi:capsule assembly Wzi family protein [Scandinavium goeteborgense]|uniref:capsule assembly Wzi family protein n=1 Tax=Scandinavium goeteborgense TaxID=1851514 RepID=UPI002166611E|nr:capsule assembly Wzi family protein [Scandinavium goeteborgense]MCS2153360.1 capsule assembly Wzi family protein [Scandinavium goeteborgense]
MKPLAVFRRQTFCLALLVCSSQAGAGLLINDAQLRSDLAWLADRDIIQLNLSTWPLSQEEVTRAIANANAPRTVANQETLARVQRRLAELKAPVRLNGWAHSASPSLPQGFGETPASAYGLGAALASSGEFWDINLQAQAESHQYISDASHYNLNGAYAGVKLFNQWLAFGEIPQWWGPGNDGSTIRSDAARPVVGFVMQRAKQTPFDTPWLAWLGNWQYQLSAGQLRHYERPEDPKLIGGRLTASPFNSLDVGMSRVLMWGGKGRPNTLDSFRDALMGRDNTGNQGRDPGDQMAGVDFRLKLMSLTGLPLTVYGQITGDDQAGIWPSHNTFLGGLEGHQSLNVGQVNWFLEAADTRSGLKDTGIIYYHYCYHGGYYQQGAPLGDGMGGDGTQYSGRMELVLENQQRLSTRLVWARVNRMSQSINQAYPASTTIKGIALGWSVPVNTWATVKTGLWSGSMDSGVSAAFSFSP